MVFPASAMRAENFTCLLAEMREDLRYFSISDKSTTKLGTKTIIDKLPGLFAHNHHIPAWSGFNRVASRDLEDRGPIFGGENK